jgi:hypothetical protein
MIDRKTGVIMAADDSMSEYWTTNMVGIDTDHVVEFTQLQFGLDFSKGVIVFRYKPPCVTSTDGFGSTSCRLRTEA